MAGTFIAALDLIGTFVFAISGAIAGVRYRLDLFGVLVLSFAAGNAGGIVRDVLIGALPPVAINNWQYVLISLCGGLATFYWYPLVNRLRTPVLVFDAVGLSLFAVDGTAKALAFHLGPVAAALLGMLTGIGGGMLRDILVSNVPAVFRAEIYAVAALSAAVFVVFGNILGLPNAPVALAGAVLCFGLRIVSIRRGWKLPVAEVPE
jgi:uncharacterized membrane protein YeiH